MKTQKTLFRFLFVLIGYFLLAALGRTFTTVNGFSAPIWLGAGFSVFCITIFGYRYAWAIYLGSALETIIFGHDYLMSFVVALAPTLEAMAGRWIFVSIIKERTLLVFHNRLISVVLSAALASAISAIIGLSTLNYFKNIDDADFLQSLLTWYGGDVAGIMLLFPLLLNLRLRMKAKEWPQAFEWLVASGACLFFLGLALATRYSSALLLFFPLLVFLVIRFGATVGLLSANLAAVTCVVTLMIKKGPFVLGSENINLFSCILYLITLAIAVLAIVSFARVRALRPNLKLLFTCWLIAFGGGLTLEFISQRNDQRHFERLVEFSKKNIQRHFEDYHTVLQGAAAFYRASTQVTKSDWETFAHDFNISKLLPGATGLGFVQPVLREDISKLKAIFQQDGVDTLAYHVKPFPSRAVLDRPDLFIIKYFEPYSQGRKIINADLGAVPTLRRAAEYARDTGKASLIPVKSILTDDKKRPGIVLMAPVYNRIIHNDDVKLRRESHLGWTTVPFVMEEFIKDSLFVQLRELDIQLIDKETNNLLFESGTHSHKGPHKAKVSLHLAQKEFKLLACPNDNFSYTFGRVASLLSSITILLSIFMAMIMVNLQLTNRRISQQVRAKTQELIATQKMAEAHLAMSVEASRLASLGEMAGGIAHEINNPLSIILAKIFNLKTKLKRGRMSNEEILPYIEKVEQTSYRIAKIVKGMRNLTHDGSQYDMEKTSLAQIVEDVLDVCREKFKSKGIEIRVNVPNNLFVECRFVQISQVLINLLNNSEHAIEHLPLPWVEIRAIEGGNFVGLEVIDSGPGIPDAIVSKMMNPFFTTKGVGKGTGLGLSIAQNIMKDHHGSLDYKKGSLNTTFVLKFPRVKS